MPIIKTYASNEEAYRELKNVEYLQSSGTQYIDTGIKNGIYTKIKYQFVGSQDNNGSIIGCENNDSPYRATYIRFIGNATVAASTLSVASSLYAYAFNNEIQKVELCSFSDYAKFIINDEIKKDITISASYSDNSYFLFSTSNGANRSKSKILYCKIYSDKAKENIVRDYQPVVFNGVGYLYDKVEHKLYGNDGTGAFTYGSILDITIYPQDSGWVDRNIVDGKYSLNAIANQGYGFKGWYINNVLISNELNISYELSGDTTFEARFERVYDITTNVVGDGAIGINRQPTDLNIVEIYVIPNANRHFVKYEVDGEEIFETPITLTLTQDISIVAYFEEDEKYTISASTNVNGATVYLSDNEVYEGTVVTAIARPFYNYNFVRWSDGNTENPRNIEVNNNVTLLAEYSKVQETNGIYQYRCYVKDQMHMEDPPKAFMVVDTFTLKEDELTNANSTINVLQMKEGINNGDVIVVYNPLGVVIYKGVITSISDLTITTSQMQSFYKGLWIYNINSQTYLEEEIASLLQDYADGKIYGSTYVDNLIAQRLGGITIQSVGALQVHLPTDLDSSSNQQYTQYDMEKFIYKMYEDYGIIFDFEINFEGPNYVTIKKPTYEAISIGNNHFAIQNLSPVTKIAETNKLVIYSKNKAYRTTYVATENGIFEQPTSLDGRFRVTNTKVVFSDDNAADLVASNLPNTMYNHKITFDLFLKNSLYQYAEFYMGMPLNIYYNNEFYYSSVLTGREMTKNSNQNVSFVSYTCGLVRQSLTKKLTRGTI